MLLRNAHVEETLGEHIAEPLQAGTVQYLVEKGYDVPENLIPPEYVPVQ